jgi:hypothetical protein
MAINWSDGAKAKLGDHSLFYERGEELPYVIKKENGTEVARAKFCTWAVHLLVWREDDGMSEKQAQELQREITTRIMEEA